MRFLTLPPEEALGGRLAHSIRLDGRRVAKGTIVDAWLADRLRDAPEVERVAVALLDEGDLPEDAAATRVAAAFAGDGLRVGDASTGRANLYAAREGLFLFDRASVLAANAVDEGITLATLAENRVVVAGQMVATVKIIPFAVASTGVGRAAAALARARVAGFAPHRVALVQTTLAHLSARALDKTRRVTEARLVARGATLVAERRCPHDALALGETLRECTDLGVDWLLVVGASAIVDRRDVVPAAIERAGGRIARFGLPMDPGNLLLLGHLGAVTVIGLPGCARSPRDNGVDRVLDRLACDVAPDDAWLDSLAVGGLLDDTVERGAPRRDATATAAGTVGVVVLAAGSSRRMGSINKLLLDVPTSPGETLVRRAVGTALTAAGSLSPPATVVVVTGHEPERVSTALEGLDVTTVHAADAASGMARSLVRGLSAHLERGTDVPDAIVVCLADMPHVDPATIRALVAARRANPACAMVVPSHRGRRGNPVLIGREWFDAVLALEGDAGARVPARRDPDAVLELPVDDPGVLVDHDVPADFT